MHRVLVPAVLGLLLPAAPAPADPPKPEPAPEFAGIADWIHTKPLTMAGLRGKVVVLHFWTYGCSNCIHNYPHMKAWRKDFKDKDVVIVGVHTPEFDREKDVEQIRKKAKENGLDFPIAVDNDGKTWRAWRTRYWPTVYLVDKKGNVRYHWEGELNWKETKGEAIMRRHIETLLNEEK